MYIGATRFDIYNVIHNTLLQYGDMRHYLMNGLAPGIYVNVSSCLSEYLLYGGNGGGKVVKKVGAGGGYACVR